MTMQQQSIEPNQVISTNDTTLKEQQYEPTLKKQLDSTFSVTVSLSPKSSYNMKNSSKKPVIPPHKRDTRKLFVGGLGKQVNNENFKQFFEQFGQVIDSIVMIDRDTNRHRGFGFVTFQDAEIAQKVLSLGNKEGQPVPEGGWKSGKIEIFGKMCEVKASEPKKGNGHLSNSCKSSCSSDSTGGFVPSNIQFQSYHSNANEMQHEIDASSGFQKGTTTMPTAQMGFSVEPSVPGSPSARISGDEYSGVMNMGQVNPISPYVIPYTHASEMYYYPVSSYPSPYENAVYNPYFYSYNVLSYNSMPINSLPYYPVPNVTAYNNYDTSFYNASVPTSFADISRSDGVSTPATVSSEKLRTNTVTKHAVTDDHPSNP